MDDVMRAMLGDHEAAERLTERGDLIPCSCGSNGRYIHRQDMGYKVACDGVICGNETLWFGDKKTAAHVWNTRAPLLTAAQMEALERMEE